MSFREFLQTRNPKKEKHNIVTLGRKKKIQGSVPELPGSVQDSSEVCHQESAMK